MTDDRTAPIPTRDWQAEIDAWTERFRSVDHPPPVFADAIAHGWDDGARQRLADEADAHYRDHEGLIRQLTDAACEAVRFDLAGDGCDTCTPYAGRPFALAEDHPHLPMRPPMPICPACRHRLNLLTPYFLSSRGQTIEDVYDDAVPYDGPR